MLSMQMFRVIVEEREREVQKELRARRLLTPTDALDSAAGDGPRTHYRDSWRATTPRARATTR